MPGGIDTQKGIHYQNFVGIIRIFDFIETQNLQYIEFESKGEALEDINLFYEDRIVLEQVKKKDGGVWAVSEIRKIVERFLEKRKRIRTSKPVFFKFTTNAAPSNKMKELELKLNDIKDNDDFFSKNYVEQCKKIYGNFPEKILIELIKKSEFSWNYKTQENVSKPLEVIRNFCINQLMNLCNVSEEEAENITSKLYQVIIDYSISEETYRRKLTRNDLVRLLPTCVADPEDLTKIYAIFPQLKIIANQNEIKILTKKEINIEPHLVIADLYIEIEKRKVLVWFLNDLTLFNSIQFQNRFEFASKFNAIYEVWFVILTNIYNKEQFPNRIKNKIFTKHEFEKKLDELILK